MSTKNTSNTANTNTKISIFDSLHDEILNSDLDEREKNRRLSVLLRASSRRVNLMLVSATGAGNQYKNARNMAAGAVRNYDAADCAGRGVVFTPFGVIEGLDEDTSKSEKLRTLAIMGFSPCKFIIPDKNAPEQIISNIVSNLQKLAESHGLPIDGIVVTYDDIPFSLSCGRTGHHYKDGMAFKFLSN